MKLFDDDTEQCCSKCGTQLLYRNEFECFVRYTPAQICYPYEDKPERLVWTCPNCGYETESHTKDYKPDA